MLTRPVWYTSMVDQSHSEFDFFWVDWVKMALLPIPLKGLIKVMPNLISQGVEGVKMVLLPKRVRMAQIGITQKETSTASQPASQPAKVASQTKHQTPNTTNQPANQPNKTNQPGNQIQILSEKVMPKTWCLGGNDPNWNYFQRD